MRKLHETRVGRCSVKIYYNSAYGEYEVRSVVGVKRGTRSGDIYFTDDKKDARSTAAAMIRHLKKRPACQPA